MVYEHIRGETSGQIYGDIGFIVKKDTRNTKYKLYKIHS